MGYDEPRSLGERESGGGLALPIWIETHPHLSALVLATALATLSAGCATQPTPPSAAELIQKAEAALGSTSIRTLTLSGRGTGGTFGQAWQPGQAWPALNYSVLERAMNFDTAAIRETFGRSRAEPNGGGAVPLMGGGEQRATGFAREGLAWNAAGSTAVAAPVALAGRQHDLWLGTPMGALKAAGRHHAMAGTRQVDGRPVHTLSFTVPGQLAATLLLDGTGLVTRIESTLPHPVLGDTAVVTEFSDYQSAGALRFPMRIRQSQSASEVLDLRVTQVQADVAVDIPVPDNVRSAVERATTEKVAEGVWFLAGGSHNSVAIELTDQIVVVESPLYDGRATAVLDAANQLVPGKPREDGDQFAPPLRPCGRPARGSGRRRGADHQQPGQTLLRTRVRQPQPRGARPPGTKRPQPAHHGGQRQYRAA
jgi:hypothetical protein